jgi:hypothetical protein
LIFAGCETEADEKIVYLPGEMIRLDVLAANVTELKAALAETVDLAIGLTGTATLADDLEVGEGKAVYILNGGTLTTAASKALTVKGVVYVGIGGKLDVSAGNVVVDGGQVSVLPVKSIAGITAGVSPGTLVITSPTSVNDGASPTPNSVLGGDNVWIGGTLKVTQAIALADVATALNYVVDGGTLDLSAAAVTGSKPSTLAGAAALSSGKNLIAKADTAESDTTLSIPANANITVLATDALAAITGLTVSGTLNISGSALTLAAVLPANGVTTTGKGKIVSATTTLTALKALLDHAGSTLVIEQSGSVNFADDQTVKAGTTLINTGTITVTAAKTLTVAGAVKAGALILGAGDWKATGANATIAANTLTLGNAASATFGTATTSKTLLTGTSAGTNTFTASGDTGATVTLSQDTNHNLVITGSGTGAKLATGATAGITVNGATGLTITGVLVDISSSTGIKLTASGDAIVLGAGSKILLADDSSAAADTNRAIKTSADGALGTAGAGITVNAASAVIKSFIPTSGATSGTTITSSAANAVIVAGIKIAAS